MSALRCLLLLAAAFVAAGLTGSRAEAFPVQRVHDRLWAKAQPWVTIDLPGGTNPQWIWVYAGGVSATCADPVSGRNEPLCATPNSGFNIHAFVDGVGEVQGPQQCLSAGCWMYWNIPAGVTRVALLVHGTHDTRGRVEGYLDLYAMNTWQSFAPLSFSGDIMVDVSAPAYPFDVETVLVPDGPILDPLGGPTRPGNAANDFLGVDATEVWMMASDGMMLRADTQTAGVGFAGRLTWSAFESQPYSSALIRPWTPPPSGFTVVLNAATQIWDTPPVGPAAVTVGEGRMRAIFNDHTGHDPDGDGLSSAVESEVGTCNGTNLWAGQTACIHASTFNAHRDNAFMDPRDTDGDGISDFAEVIGSDVSQGRLPRADGACDDAAPVLQAGANLTLPLWGFNPLHKDALIEIDMGPRNGEAACPAIGAMDTTCNAAGGQTYALPPMGTASLSDYLGGLREWHQIYATLSASRVNNPDGAAGIELHFDVTTAPVASTRHGTRSQFTTIDHTGQARPGLLTFDSTGASGSSCSCKNQQNCISARMGGFGRWTRHNDAYGGGQSPPAGPVDGAIRPGATPAHELGHHLGLAHGGPYSNRGNPFILSSVRDAEQNDKLVHVSLMTYAYAYIPNMRFSLGAYSPYPLPRQATDGSGLFGYQETLPTEGDVTTQPFHNFGEVGQGYAPGPAACTGASCVHTDFDRSGTIGGVRTGGLSGTEVLLGSHDWIYQVSYYCPMEEVRATLPNSNGRCCRTGRRDTSGVCPSGGLPDAQPATRTMLLAGQSATVAANNRLYTFFLDDHTPDPPIVSADRPESRRTCSRLGEFPSMSCAALTDAKLRWAAIDGFSVPTGAGAPFACTSRDCVTPVANQLGNLAVDGEPTPLPGSVARFTGSTQLAATTLGSGSNQKVILAWATRRSSANGGLRCVANTPWCANDWSPMEVRFGNATTIETAGVQVLGPTGTGLFNDVSTSDGAPRGAHVSGVALAAWDPDNNGEPTRAMLIARVVGAPASPGAPPPLPPDEGELYWTMCDVSAGCGQMQRLTTYVSGAEGGVVRSFTAIAAAVDHPSSGAPSLALAMGGQSTLTGLADMQVLRMMPAPSTGAPFERRLYFVQESASARRRSLEESSVSVAFTAASHGNRMILTAEGVGDQGGPVMYYWTAVRPFAPSTDTYYRLDTEWRNPWDFSRATVGTTFNSTGQIVPLRADAPGYVASLYQDARPNVTGGDARIAFLEGDVRAGVQHLGQHGPKFLLRPFIDSRPLTESYNYEEVASLAYWLCPNLPGGSRGTIGPDLIARGSPLEGLRCQRGAAWGRNSGGIANLTRLAHFFCSGPCPRGGTLPADYLSIIADYVTQPSMLAPPIAAPPPEYVALDVSPRALGVCGSDVGAAATLASPVPQ